MKLTLSTIVPLALFFAAASAAPQKEKEVECIGVGSISAAANKYGKYYEICKCPEGTAQELLYTLAGPSGGYFCAAKEE